MHFTCGGSNADVRTTAPLHLFILKITEALIVLTNSPSSFLSVKYSEFTHNVYSMLELGRLTSEAMRWLLVCLPVAM